MVVGVIGSTVVALIAIVAFWPGEKEPVYQGKKLSEWLCVYIVSDGTSEVASNAVLQIGTNGLPWMMKGISYEPARWRVLAAKLPKPFNGVGRYGDGTVRRALALRAFRILKSVARPAVPQLVEWASDAPKNSQRRAYAVLALAGMGNEDEFLQIPRLVRELRSTDAGMRDSASNELMRIAPEMLTNGVSAR